MQPRSDSTLGFECLPIRMLSALSKLSEWREAFEISGPVDWQDLWVKPKR